MDLQMKNQKLNCPSCGHTYARLFWQSRSICPFCNSVVKTDLRTVGILETVVGVPLLWLIATWLRTVLNDSEGMLAYGLLVIPAFAIHFLVVWLFVKASIVNTKSSTDD